MRNHRYVRQARTPRRTASSRLVLGGRSVEGFRADLSRDPRRGRGTASARKLRMVGIAHRLTTRLRTRQPRLVGSRTPSREFKGMDMKCSVAAPALIVAVACSMSLIAIAGPADAGTPAGTCTKSYEPYTYEQLAFDPDAQAI